MRTAIARSAMGGWPSKRSPAAFEEPLLFQGPQPRLGAAKMFAARREIARHRQGNDQPRLDQINLVS